MLPISVQYSRGSVVQFIPPSQKQQGKLDEQEVVRLHCYSGIARYPTHGDVLAAQNAYKALSPEQKRDIAIQKVHSVAMAIFGSIQATIQHFCMRNLNATFVQKGLWPCQFEQKIARYGRKLHFLTDYDVARQSLKKINAERLDQYMTLGRTLLPFFRERTELMRTAACLREKLSDLKAGQKEAEKAFRKMNKIYSTLSNIEHVPVSLRSLSMNQAIDICDHFRLFLNESQQKIKEWKCLKKVEWKCLKEVKEEWEKEIKDLKQLFETKLEKYHRNKKKLDLMPRFLSGIQIYPPLIFHCGDAQISFSPGKFRINVNLMTSPPTLSYNHLGGEPNPDEVMQLVEKMAKGLKVEPHDLLTEVETKGWQHFLEARIIPSSKLDYQSAHALASLQEKQELPLAHNIKESDVQDMVSLDSFEKPVTLTCGHTFSWGSIKEQELCPHCRTEIDYDGILPNEFLNQLSLIYKQKPRQEKLQKLDKDIKAEYDKLKDLYYQVKQIDLYRLQKNAQVNQFDDNLRIMERAMQMFNRYVQVYSNSIEEETPEQLMRKFQQELDEIEGKIEQADASIHQLELEQESIEFIGNSRLITMAHALADAYQRGDLVAVIPMDIAKNGYIDKLTNKLAIAKKNLAAAKYVYFNHPELIKSAETIFEVTENVFKPRAYPVTAFSVSRDPKFDSLS